jgi:GTP-binding protein EngB required for normal cell division
MDSNYTQIDPSRTFIVLGETGVGKSTFINVAIGSNAPTSNTPDGVTQNVTFYKKNGLTLVDTPGLGDAD